jgi:hypothetical protein
MPPRGHKTSPSFTPDRPRELRRYFQDLDVLFASCQVQDDQDKKQYACRYLDVDSAEIWEGLTEYQPPATYGEFVTAVHKLYPQSGEE